MLGKSHAQKSIRPWQYATFITTLLNTIASRLGTNATNDVMESWVHLFAFVMKSMLPEAIRNGVVETELNINMSSEFSAGEIAEEIAEVEEVKDLKKRLGGSKRSATNSEVSSTEVANA